MVGIYLSETSAESLPGADMVLGTIRANKKKIEKEVVKKR